MGLTARERIAAGDQATALLFLLLIMFLMFVGC
ncbi:hypothetical protein VT85_22400 [Planctomyces sp. SH-PL62]|nr:hypothetical protein VT85_22400 [Planctomyces sp. SH-PL62]